MDRTDLNTDLDLDHPYLLNCTIAVTRQTTHHHFFLAFTFTLAFGFDIVVASSFDCFVALANPSLARPSQDARPRHSTDPSSGPHRRERRPRRLSQFVRYSSRAPY